MQGDDIGDIDAIPSLHLREVDENSVLEYGGYKEQDANNELKHDEKDNLLEEEGFVSLDSINIVDANKDSVELDHYVMGEGGMVFPTNPREDGNESDVTLPPDDNNPHNKVIISYRNSFRMHDFLKTQVIAFLPHMIHFQGVGYIRHACIQNQF